MKQITKRILLVVALLISTFTISTKIVSASTEDGIVAKIDNTSYTSLSEAIDAAEENQTVILDMDTTENITISKAITLDLAGYTLTGIGNGSVVTIKNVSTENGISIINGTITGGSSISGAGLFINSSTVNLSNLIITNNNATGNGGGVYIYPLNEGNTVTITNSTISGNTSGGSGGGISASVNSGKLLIKDSTITDNKLYKYNQEVSYSGSGAGISISSGNVIIENTKVTNNDAGPGNGGGITSSYSNLTIKDSLIDNNKAVSTGGGITASTKTNLDLENTTISNNTSGLQGGGIFGISATIKINNATITGNTSNNTGGGIYLGYCTLNENSIKNSTITNNTASWGGGLSISNCKDVYITSDLIINNNTGKNYGADDIYSTSSTLTLSEPAEGTLDSCNHSINGWYFDGYNGTEWVAHSENHEGDYTYKMQYGTYTSTVFLKAAHNNGKVITHYVDINGNTLSEDVTSIDAVGSTYTTNPLDITDYVLVKVEGNSTGEFTEEDIEVTYVYKYNIGTVIVNYVDKDGNELTKSITISGTIGEEYTTEEKEFDSYVLVKVDGDSTGTITEGTIEVTYIYEWFDKNAKGGDVDNSVEVLPPQTGITKTNNNVLSLLSIIGMLFASLLKGSLKRSI